jgi:hypothetical protein
LAFPECAVAVIGVPMVVDAKLPRLSHVLMKIFTQVSPEVSIDTGPLTDGMSSGIAIVEFETKAAATLAVKKCNGYHLDKHHQFTVVPHAELEAYKKWQDIMSQRDSRASWDDLVVSYQIQSICKLLLVDDGSATFPPMKIEPKLLFNDVVYFEELSRLNSTNHAAPAEVDEPIVSMLSASSALSALNVASGNSQTDLSVKEKLLRLFAKNNNFILGASFMMLYFKEVRSQHVRLIYILCYQ